MVFAGYASTNTADLVDEIIEPEAFRKHLKKYEKRPVICYNHDRNIPIGKAEQVEITAKGLYMGKIKLTEELEVNQKVIWPLIKDGVLTSMSIGFLSLDGKMEGSYYHHTEVYLLENSVVTVACNPDALIGVSKDIDYLVEQYGRMNTVNDLIGAYNKGFMNLPSEKIKTFYMYNPDVPTEKMALITPNQEKQIMEVKTNPTLLPDFSTVKAIPLVENMATKYDQDGESVRKPYATQKNYASVNELIYAAKRVDKDKDGKEKTTYLFEIGHPTTKGYAYDWDKVALAMCKLLGAKGGVHFDPAEKALIITRLSDAYATLNKAMPCVAMDPQDADTLISVDQLIDEELAGLKYSDIKFIESEKELLEVKIFETDLINVENIAKSWKERGSITKEAREIAKKSIYAMFDIFGFIDDTGDAELAGKLLTLVAQHQEEEDCNVHSAYDEASLSAPKKALIDAFREFTAGS